MMPMPATTSATAPMPTSRADAGEHALEYLQLLRGVDDFVLRARAVNVLQRGNGGLSGRVALERIAG